MHRYLPWSIHELVSVSTFADDRLRIELSSSAQEAYKYGFHEADLTMACILLVAPGSVFVDIGANFGYFTVLAARLVGRSGSVYGFEPTPRTYGMLQHNVAGLGSVVIESVAVSSHAGFATLRDYGSEYSGFNTLSDRPRSGLKLKAKVHRVATIALDDYFRDLPKPGFVKIDAENAELAILAGMQNILATARPVVSLEVGDADPARASRSRDLVDFMSTRGYSPFAVDGVELRPHTPLRRYDDFANLVFLTE
jgi:FkbM family methyltransferase